MATARLGAHAALFESQASSYAQFRPSYPAALYAAIEAFAGGPAAAAESARQLALDVGCGSGQVAVELSERYDQVVACDPSRAQLQHAAQRPNLRYLQAPAERLPPDEVASGSVDLATAAQCLHWLDIPRFYAEMRRVLKPSGALAMWGYDLHSFEAPPGSSAYPPAALEEANRRLQHLYGGSGVDDCGVPGLGPYWDGKRRLVEAAYRGVEPVEGSDFGVVQRRELTMHRDMSLAGALGYASSWSAYSNYRRHQPELPDPLAAFGRRLQQVLGIADADVEREGALRLVWPVFMVLAKQPVQVQEAR